MKSLYMQFYESQTRKIPIEKVEHQSDLNSPFTHLDEDFVHLDSNILIGRIDHKKQFGFLRQELRDLYLDGKDLFDAMHDDIVLVKEGVEPKVVFIVERALKSFIATLRQTKKGLIAEPDSFIDRRVEVDGYNGYVHGHVVMMDVDAIDQNCVYAKIRKLIGHINDPDINTMKIVESYEWPTRFSEELLAEINAMTIDIELEKTLRKDLSDQLIVTIDGKDAKDLDDAISLIKSNDHYHLGVHIADVSHYVRNGSLLDQEAYRRSTSSYLADRVIPMLPHKLSNDWCSLNPNEPKLTLSCHMVLDKEARLVSYDIQKTIITSHRRLTYDEVNQWLNHGKSLKDDSLDAMLVHMNELSQKLKKIRHSRGEIEFESSELGFVVNEKGVVLDVYERKTDQAEELIESLMLIANETVAQHMHFNELPAIYRVHDEPDPIKLKTALQLVAKLGLPVNMKQLGSFKPLQILTEKAANTPYQSIVHMALLRAMQKAVYSEKSGIHYGLGARYYSHFTSPIRRYPDLILHRMIHLFVFGETPHYQKDYHSFDARMPEIAMHTSTQERKAIQMERDVSKLKSCEFMANKIGHAFKATLTQMMPSGMFIKLSNGIEGFVPLRLLNDYFMFDENQLTYVGSKGKRYRLGDTLKVELVEVDLITRKMDYVIVDKPKKKRNSHENHRRK